MHLPPDESLPRCTISSVISTVFKTTRKTQRDYFVPTPSHSNNARPKSNLLYWHEEEQHISHSHIHWHTLLQALTLLMTVKHSWKLPMRKLKWLEFGENSCTVIKTCFKTCHEMFQYFDSSHRFHHLYNLWIINKTQITEDHVSKVVRLEVFGLQSYF